MKTANLCLLCLATLGLSLSSARAQDANTVPPPPLPNNAPASPQDGAPPPHRRARPGYVLAELTQKLSLTPQEQTAVGAIISSARAQMKALRADDTLSQADRRAKVKAVLEDSRVQIRAALTPEQQAIFDTLPASGPKQ